MSHVCYASFISQLPQGLDHDHDGGSGLGSVFITFRCLLSRGPERGLPGDGVGRARKHLDFVFLVLACSY